MDTDNAEQHTNHVQRDDGHEQDDGTPQSGRDERQEHSSAMSRTRPMMVPIMCSIATGSARFFHVPGGLRKNSPLGALGQCRLAMVRALSLAQRRTHWWYSMGQRRPPWRDAAPLWPDMCARLPL